MATQKSTKTVTEASIDIIEVSRGVVEYALLGATPLIMNRMPEKARQHLLFPSGPKNKAERAMTLKHDPFTEFQSSAHLMPGDLAPTLLGMPSVAFKQAMATAALDLPGTNKSQIGRLLYVEERMVSVWGEPELLMAVVKSADIGRTPDIRTRLIIPRWACRLRVRYTRPLIRAEMISRLLVAAGMTVGVGDWRQQKGAGDHGLFTIVSEDDQEFQEIITTGGRAAQIEAYEAPTAYDRDTADLWAWFGEERERRQQKGVA